jgi:hypothetical protein
MHMSSTCQAHVKHMSSTCQAHVKHTYVRVFCKCLQHSCTWENSRMLTALAEALVTSTGQMLDGSARLVLEHARVWDIVHRNPAALQLFTHALDEQDGRSGIVDYPKSPGRRRPQSVEARGRSPQFKENGKRRGSRSPSKAQRRALARSSKKLSHSFIRMLP